MLYEFGFNFKNYELLFALFWISCSVFFCYLLILRFDKKIIRILIIFIETCLIALVGSSLLIDPIKGYFWVKEKYELGECEVVCGAVADFDSPETSIYGHVSESFTINGITFEYMDNEYGYSTFKCDGGVITHEGQKLKITYCNDPYSTYLVICAIEEVD